MDGAYGVLLSIAGGSDLGLFEINESASLVQEAAHPEANIIFGTVIDDSLGDEVRVTVIAAGFDSGSPTHKKLEPQALGSASGSSTSTASAQAGQVQRPPAGAHRLARLPRRRAVARGLGGPDGARLDAGRRPRVGGASGGDPGPGGRLLGQRVQRLPGSSGGHGRRRGVHRHRGLSTTPPREAPSARSADEDDVDVPSFMRR